MFAKSILVSLTTLLISCGGGGSSNSDSTTKTASLKAEPVSISLYGDSYSGSSWDISKLSNNRINLINYAVGGCTTSNARYGQPVNFVFYGNFQLQMLGGDKSDIVLIRFGVAEAILNVKNSIEFRDNLIWFVEQARLAHKQPILVNMLQVPSTKFFEANKLLPVFDEYNGVIESVSQAQKVILIDIRSQVKVTVEMMSTDEVHLTPQASLVVDTVITQELLKYLDATTP
jgi:hypothetical protein